MDHNTRSKVKSQSADREMNDDQDMDMDEQSETRGTRQGRGQKGQGRQVAARGEEQSNDILASITPAFNEARRYIEGSPVRAAAIGAVAGGLLMTIFSTEKGRQFAKMAYDYANPMVAKYARDYVSRAAGDLAENAVSQH
ncbi:MAG: hypothetical protein EOP05_19490 [Proteobacteria bacterium]|nr:MAG: hypothetical protein EOP05_19490 [Pseudomonadota bacterium]